MLLEIISGSRGIHFVSLSFQSEHLPEARLPRLQEQARDSDLHAARQHQHALRGGAGAQELAHAVANPPGRGKRDFGKVNVFAAPSCYVSFSRDQPPILEIVLKE